MGWLKMADELDHCELVFMRFPMISLVSRELLPKKIDCGIISETPVHAS